MLSQKLCFLVGQEIHAPIVDRAYVENSTSATPIYVAADPICWRKCAKKIAGQWQSIFITASILKYII
jgi:hypothetical protein